MRRATSSRMASGAIDQSVVSLIALIFGALAFAASMKTDITLELWKRSLNRLEYMLGVPKTQEMSFKEFRQRVKELEDDREFLRQKYIFNDDEDAEEED
jgi:hypothetical protein